MNKTVIYLMRHGEVENPKQILYGRLPGFRLSENGRKGVEETAQVLKNKGISVLYTSPLLRARETGSIVNKYLLLKPKRSRLILESKILAQGVALSIFKKDIQPHMYEDEYVKKGQESVKSQEDRMTRFLRLIEKRHPNKNILVVSHGDPIIILKAKLLGIPFSWQFKRDNYLLPGQFITIVIKDNRFQII